MRRFLTRGCKSSGITASRAARFVGDSCRRGSKYQRSSVARRRSSRSFGSSALYSRSLSRMRSRISGGRFVRLNFAVSAGVIASSSRNKSTGDFKCGTGGNERFAGAENNFRGAGTFVTVQRRAGNSDLATAKNRGQPATRLPQMAHCINTSNSSSACCGWLMREWRQNFSSASGLGIGCPLVTSATFLASAVRWR